MKREYCVYEIVNSWNDKRYIGLTVNFSTRKAQHFSAVYRKQEPKKTLYKAMKVFGQEKFTMSVLLDKLTKDEAMFAESYLINKIPTFSPHGYNKAKEIYQLKKEERIEDSNPKLIAKLNSYLISKRGKPLL